MEPEKHVAPYAHLAPKMAQLSSDVLYGDVWERTDLSKRDRSLITVAALVATCRPEQTGFHMQRALQNGVKETELVELITHLAFYAGWPSAVTAIGILQQLLDTNQKN
jgi:4-carboxymuconolactone decarboxylase